jgi:hypothetical protein
MRKAATGTIPPRLRPPGYRTEWPMTKLAPSQVRLCISFAAALLVGCGESQPPIGAQGAMPQSRVIATHSGSWMLSQAKSEELVYVSVMRPADVIVLSYPQLNVVGELQDVGQYGLCSDRSGNVFVPSWDSSSSDGVVYEFAHGGSTPTATLSEGKDFFPVGCSVDPTTGNLAVTNSVGPVSCYDPIAVFPGAQAPPTLVCPKYAVAFCGYDDKGDLYIDGRGERNRFVFAELRKGSSNLEPIALKGHGLQHDDQVQWDGKHITIEEGVSPRIYALEITGTKAKIIATTTFARAHKATQSWIVGRRVFLPFGTVQGETKLGVWRYPGGGNPLAFKLHVGNALRGVTVSAAPSREAKGSQ